MITSQFKGLDFYNIIGGSYSNLSGSIFSHTVRQTTVSQWSSPGFSDPCGASRQFGLGWWSLQHLPWRKRFFWAVLGALQNRGRSWRRNQVEGQLHFSRLRWLVDATLRRLEIEVQVPANDTGERQYAHYQSASKVGRACGRIPNDWLLHWPGDACEACDALGPAIVRKLGGRPESWGHESFSHGLNTSTPQWLSAPQQRLNTTREYCRVIVSLGLNASREYCRVIVSLGLNTSTPERLLQSDCQPWAQHLNSTVIVSLGLDTSTCPRHDERDHRPHISKMLIRVWMVTSQFKGLDFYNIIISYSHCSGSTLISHHITSHLQCFKNTPRPILSRCAAKSLLWYLEASHVFWFQRGAWEAQT